MTDRFAIILAAGKGTRMKSPRPKVLHEIGGRSMLAWSVALAKDLGCKRTVVVVGPDMPQLSEAAAKLVGAENVAVQREQLGTANAVDAARGQLADARRTLALWRYDYNNVRPHSSLGNRTPAEARRALEQYEGSAPGALAHPETNHYQPEGLSL